MQANLSYPKPPKTFMFRASYKPYVSRAYNKKPCIFPYVVGDPKLRKIGKSVANPIAFGLLS